MLQFEKLLNIFGVSGYEADIRNYIIQNISKLSNKIIMDNVGNIIVKFRSINNVNKKNIVIAAHMDEVGVKVKEIKEDGNIKFSELGSLKVRNLLMNKIIFKNGVVGVITSEYTMKDIKPRDMEALGIDCGFLNKNEAEKAIDIGEVGTFYNDYFENEDIIISKAIDNRVGCWVLLNLIENFSVSNDDITFIFTCQEEVGFKGMEFVIGSINPDIVIDIDTISVENIRELQLGKGPTIKICDSLTNCSEELISKFKKISKEYSINTQLEITDNGGTELSVIKQKCNNVKLIGLSVPIKYGHSANSIVNKSDILECIRLLNVFIKS